MTTLTSGRGRGAVTALGLVLVALAAIALLEGCGDKENAAETGARGRSGEAASAAATEPGMSADAAGSEAKEETSESRTETADLTKLLDLGSDKCIPCKAMEPIIEEMHDTFAGSLYVEFIDVWKDRDAAKKYEIKVIPTQIFLDADGHELFRHQGFFSRDDMLAKWRELGYDFEG